ncbi:unnamed protein product, partial [Ixodes pacificus]
MVIQESVFVGEPNLAVVPPQESGPPSANAVFSGLHLPFVGFTYTLGSRLAQGEETAVDDSHLVCRRKIQALEREKQDMCQRMARDLKRGLPNSGGGGDVVLRNSSTTDGEVRKLQDEVNTFRKKNA